MSRSKNITTETMYCKQWYYFFRSLQEIQAVHSLDQQRQSHFLYEQRLFSKIVRGVLPYNVKNTRECVFADHEVAKAYSVQLKISSKRRDIHLNKFSMIMRWHYFERKCFCSKWFFVYTFKRRKRMKRKSFRKEFRKIHNTALSALWMNEIGIVRTRES